MMDKRYSRQIVFSHIGKQGQNKLKKSKVLVIGCGALGSVSAEKLARAGVGSITLVDRDRVKIENLSSQNYNEKDKGKMKASALQQYLKKINSKIKIKAINKELTEKNAKQIIKGHDLVIDGLDNMKTRYIVNKACIALKVPWIYGAAIKSSGMVFVTMPKKACFQCVFPNPPKLENTCELCGVIVTAPSIVANMQVTEALKVLLDKKPSNKLIIIDVWDSDFELVKVNKRKTCKVC